MDKPKRERKKKKEKTRKRETSRQALTPIEKLNWWFRCDVLTDQSGTRTDNHCI